MGQLVVAPESRMEPFLELSRTRQGRIFKKHILSVGTLFANGKKIDVDEVFLSAMVDNFHARYCDIVQVPIVGKDNKHSEDPRDNIGEVVDLKVEDGKLYSFIDSRKEDASGELGKTLIGASAMFSPNYLDTNTNQTVGPTLLHVAITNRPHVLNLDDFEEVISASAGGDEIVLLTEQSSDPAVDLKELEETQIMTKEELLEQLKAEHSVDVAAILADNDTLAADKTSISEELVTVIAERDSLKAEATTLEEVTTKLSNSITEHLNASGLIQLSSDGGSPQVDSLIAAVVDAGTTVVALSGRVDALEVDKLNTAAATHVDGLIASGHILPANREAMVELRLSNSEIFDKIVPETPLIELSNELGTSGDPAPNSSEYVESEVSRLLNNK